MESRSVPYYSPTGEGVGKRTFFQYHNVVHYGWVEKTMRTGKEVHRRMMDLEEVEIVPISVEELRADKSGFLVQQMAALAFAKLA